MTLGFCGLHRLPGFVIRLCLRFGLGDFTLAGHQRRLLGRTLFGFCIGYGLGLSLQTCFLGGLLAFLFITLSIFTSCFFSKLTFSFSTFGCHAGSLFCCRATRFFCPLLCLGSCLCSVLCELTFALKPFGIHHGSFRATHVWQA